MRNRDSWIRSFIYLAILFVIVVLSASSFGCAVEAGEPQATVVSAPPVYLGPDQDARKHNTPKLMAALKRYLNAHNALRDEMTSYQSEMDVDYDRLHPILEEMQASIVALDKEVKNFDKATAKEPHEDHSVSRRRDVERPYDLLTGFP